MGCFAICERGDDIICQVPCPIQIGMTATLIVKEQLLGFPLIKRLGRSLAAPSFSF